MDMIERVARAITVAEGDDPDGITGSLLNANELWWRHRMPQARAAIEAMREPTEAMLAGGVAAADSMTGEDLELFRPTAAQSIWQSMLDAALAKESAPVD